MVVKRDSKNWIRKAAFGCLFGIMMILGMSAPVYAEPVGKTQEVMEAEDAVQDETEDDVNVEESQETETTTNTEINNASSISGKGCQDSLGALGWLVCPTTGKLAEAVDWLYERIEGVLVINPVEMKDGAPIFEIWKYMKGVTNVVFIGFLLVMVYSQITGLGITNYGLKKTLPKLIVAAILVNLSFIICSLAVDVSNIVGEGLRGIFTTVEETTMANMTVTGINTASEVEMASLETGGVAALVVAGAVAVETGAIWMLIPTVLGAIVAVVVGLITIAMRQAVVALLIMISPLAMVAYILPNTEKWFKQWKDLLFKMLIFYPMFSLLFGASQLAGWAIIVSATDGFGLMLGVAVQIFPLFFSWSLMKMSGTFLSTINTKLSALAAKPLAVNRGWAESRRELSRQKYLASRNVYTPSLRLAQFLNDRKVMRDEETAEHASTVKMRGQAYAAKRNYRDKDMKYISREGEEAYEAQYRRAEYQRIILRHQNNFNKGIGGMGTSLAQNMRLDNLDDETIKAFDTLKFEQARSEKIDYDNAMGFHKRMEDAMNAHFDSLNVGRNNYKRHEIANRAAAELRYADALKTMDGNALDTQYAAAFAAHAYDTQAKIVSTKFQKYFELTPPTKDVMYRLEEFSKYQNALNQWIEAKNKGIAIDPSFRVRATDNIDAIVSGLRVVNQRGDTDLVKSIIDDLMAKEYGGVELGTHASQALASFLMFDVKDSDPFLRRFGKYINLETARMYDANERKERYVDFDEYIKGYHDEYNPKTGKMEHFYAKKSMIKLLEGTSFDNIERTAMSNMDDSLKKAYGYDAEHKDKAWDRAGWLKKLKETMTAIEPQFLSANQKYLSGSEQMNSFVKFWTGYSIKPKKRKNKDTGLEEFLLDERGEQIFDISPIWNDKEFRGFEDELRSFYTKNVGDFYKDQTTAQVLNTRTDWRAPSFEHLCAMYLSDSTVGEEELAKRNAEYGAEQAKIIAKYKGKTSSGDIVDRDKELQKLKESRASAQLIKILGESGKLKQIYRTRGGGTAINSKDWLRKLVHLDDEALLQQEVAYYDKLKREAKEKIKRDESSADSAEDAGSGTRIYDESFREECKAELYDMYDVMRDDTPAAFYGATMEAVRDWFGRDSLIEYEYKKYYEERGEISTVVDLSKYLDELLDDMSKYPDA